MTNIRISVQDWLRFAKSNEIIPIRTLLNGYSMQPFIRYRQDYVTILPVQKQVTRGDIILFERPNKQYVVHRVFRTRQCEVQTMGDRYLHPDDWISRDAVLGCVVTVERNGHKYRTDTAGARFIGKLWMDLRWLRKRYSEFRRMFKKKMER